MVDRPDRCQEPRRRRGVGFHPNGGQEDERLHDQPLGADIDRVRERAFQERPCLAMSISRHQRVADRDLRVRRLPPPPKLAEERCRLLERPPCRVEASLVHEIHAAKVGDPAEPSLVAELAQKALALVEQPPTFVEIGLVEAQDAKRPLDLALVVPLTRESEALASIRSRDLGLTEVRSRERRGAQRLPSKVGIGVGRSFERGREPSVQLPQARARPETPERTGGQTKLALRVARGDEPSRARGGSCRPPDRADVFVPRPRQRRPELVASANAMK